MVHHDNKRKIPVPPGYRLESDAMRYHGNGNVIASPYFPNLDFFNMTSNDHLTMISYFKTYQQTRPYSCASAIALMVLHHFGNANWQEMDIADAMAAFHGLPTETQRPVPVSDLVAFFSSIGWDVDSNLSHTKPFKAEQWDRPWSLRPWASFPTEEAFSKFCRNTLAQGVPIMVENIDWGGHWRIIVGYDTMGTETLDDDVLILVDPHDTADHWQDGFVVEHMQKFFHTWFDIFVMDTTERLQPWVVARPTKEM